MTLKTVGLTSEEVRKSKEKHGDNTLEKEKTFGDVFTDRSLSDVMEVDTVAGATKTTGAYREAVKLALEAFEKITKEGGQ